MSDILSIRLTPDLRRELKRMSKQQKRSSSDIARDALRRYLALEKFRDLRRRSRPYAEASGFFTDEDIFRAVS